jgi:macrolide transport system ATP-binding/permease protein
MLILEANHIRKEYADRLIFVVEDLKIYSEDRIGIVGLNGAGKTTLLHVLAGAIKPDEGEIRWHGTSAYIRQLGDGDGTDDMVSSRKFGLNGQLEEEQMSGGEKTRRKIAQAFTQKSDVLFADEPTCNLDMKGINLLEKAMKQFRGALVVISHDRELLDHVCNRILEIEDGKIRSFTGNYSEYRKQKEREFKRSQLEYEEYVKTKEQLQRAAMILSNKAERYNDMSVNDFQRGKSSEVAQKAKALKTRIEKLEKKEKPKDTAKTRIDVQKGEAPVSKTLISGRNIGKAFGKRSLFKDFSFEIPNRSKVALVGDNGTGKTTLIRMILSGEGNIRLAPGVKIGYFSQSLDILDGEKTILENVMAESAFPESFARLILARLLFRSDDVYKKVGVLSGGEQVKAAFAKIFLQNVNLIILDEPTNYLDIFSQEALEQVLKDYEGTMLFTSHDRRFINAIADHVLLLEDGRGMTFKGNYDQYAAFEKTRQQKEQGDGALRRLLLENRLAEITGKLSMPAQNTDREALDREYGELVSELNRLKREKEMAR